MNRFLDDPFHTEDYSKLRPEVIAGVKCVDLKSLLDILNKRAIFLIRKCADPQAKEPTTQLHRGQLAEISALYHELEKYETE